MYYKVEKIWIFWVKKNYSLCLSLENPTKKTKQIIWKIVK
jgi:hypothetical protein